MKTSFKNSSFTPHLLKTAHSAEHLKPSKGAGFTLIELLIYTTVFAIASGLLTTILVATTRINNTEIVNTQVGQELNLILTTVQRLVRDASLIECAGPDQTTCSLSTSGPLLRLRFKDLAIDPTCVYLDTNTIKLAGPDSTNKYCDLTTATNLTTTNVKADSLNFTKFDIQGGHATVQIDAQLSYNSVNPQLAVTKTLRSAVGRVSAATFDSNLIPNVDDSISLGQIGPNRKWKNLFVSNILGLGTFTDAQGDPISTTAGTLYYNTTTGNERLRVYNGTSWQNVGSQTPWTQPVNAKNNTLFGNDIASGVLTLESTSNATKGNIILNPTGGNVGIGTTPGSIFDLNGATSLRGITAAAAGLSPLTQGRIYFDSSANKFKVSENNTAYVDLVGGGGGGGSALYFGDGPDGTVDINSGGFSGGNGAISSNSLTRDAYFNNLTLSGGNLDPKGWKIYVKGTLTINATFKIFSNGGNGGNGNGGSGANGSSEPPDTIGGIAGTAAHGAGSLAASTTGVPGGGGGGGKQGGGTGPAGRAGGGGGVSVTTINSYSRITPISGVSGGQGGDSGDPDNNGGSPGGGGAVSVASAPAFGVRSIFEVFRFLEPSDALLTSFTRYGGSNSSSGSGGGGGGAGSYSLTSYSASAGSGGGSGGSGGNIYIAASSIVNNGIIEAKGGTGGTGGGGGAGNGFGGAGGGGGGGSGGSGGMIYLIYKTKTGSGVESVSGGAGGGIGPGGSGGGSPGIIGNTGAAGTVNNYLVL